MVSLDNFGIFLAGHFRTLTGGATDVTLKNIAGVDRSVRIYGTNSQTCYNDLNDGTVNDRAQVGKGLTPATRQDVSIESPFILAPESNEILSIIAGYNSGLGKIEISTVITPTGGSGAVSEVVKISSIIQLATANPESFAFFRDNVSPVANFIIGETININKYDDFVLDLC